METFGRWYVRILGFSMLICAVLVSIFGENFQPAGFLAEISLVLGTIFSILFFTKQKNVVE